MHDQTIQASWRTRIRAQVAERYPLDRSPLFQMRSIHSLSHLLRLKVPELRSQCAGPRYTQPHIVTKPGRSSKPRNITAPLGKTLSLHYRLLELFDRVERPAFLHSATRGRSHVTNACAHARATPVLAADIRRFYESTTRLHLVSFFQHELKMAADLARMLATLCTAQGHLPLGSPLSPLLSYFVHCRMFEALNRLCELEGITLTVYVDDLTFSGERATPAWLQGVRQIIHRAGLRLKPGSTRVYTRRATKTITGVAVRGRRIHLPPARYTDAWREIQTLASAVPAERSRAANRIHGLIGEAQSIDSMAASSLRRLWLNAARPQGQVGRRCF
jgi:RNA-directed DNA polymerase